MKKILFIIALLSLLSTTILSASAAEATITVTIANGDICAHEEIPLLDYDENGKLTINDALIGIHDAAYEGDGYAYYQGPYGMAISKLWGIDNGGSYGYCVNDQSAMSLDDAIQNGDRIYAYLYTDLTYWSDTYSYFSLSSKTAFEGEKVEITLYQSGYDENFNTVTLPVSGAVLTINGETTDYVTDENGTVSLTASEAGIFLVSAEKEGMALVPPVMDLTVLPAASPETADFGISLTLITVMAFAIAAAICLTTHKRYQ